MNIQNTKKLTSTLLACALMLGGAISASAAEPSKETVKVMASAEMIEAIRVDAATMVADGEEAVSVQFTPLDGAVSDSLTISVVPLSKLVAISDPKALDGQDSIPAIRLVPAKTIPMEKIILE